jgi:hypothetical protein
MSDPIRSLPLVTSAALIAAAGAGLAPANPPVTEQTVYYDGPAGPDGVLTGGRVTMRLPDMSSITRASSRTSNSADNRVDIVFVGDGYTQAELPAYHADVDVLLASLYSLEPFTTYENYFRIHEIDVVSPESGVDNDPQGVFRDTALDMTFWCNGIERLLCVNVSKAYSYANLAPDVDQVIAVANTTKYGGAGYPFNNLGTVAGGNGAAADIFIHELGHSLGDLADEYTYGGPANYTGPERPEPNVSIYNASEIASFGIKWAAWLGSVDPRFDSAVGAYEGGYYSVTGVYRPSPNSMMRSLGRRFNGPSAEAFIKEIYREVSPIDQHTPNDQPLGPNDSVTVTPMSPVGHQLDITWAVDGQTVAVGSGEMTLDLSTLSATAPFTLTATVVDNTDMVRDENIRGTFLTQTVQWTIEAPCPGDVSGDGTVTTIDLLLLLSNWGNVVTGGPEDGDFDESSTVGTSDLLILLANWGNAC